ncbi:GIY-YIG nuclease family protein [Bradyrhizobium sp. INPA01-394B]|uniref:GIY-YIG nuclease family protein n=1 Tax=Bradyrhizobium campsiandrae TaxID=1729892 RepID=A0ABR7UCS4_9BRAD|nr:GIY-YIG nuclease family protein [Bradyrhizobium campsiandrae]MBC9881168.1 GIY-YIG nuclease family protein [Bradyrhizobium campsiandrae]MBC9981851.1 GIY-YIG nuclease family protein [Bradyrhizobium campsiandrae]
MSIDRKAAIAAYKERKSIAGIYVVRCAVTGEAWVGQAPNLKTIQNRIWFTLRQGGHPCRNLQAAWNRHGEAGLTFGECERLEDEESAYVRNALLTERLAYWRAELKAEAI